MKKYFLIIITIFNLLFPNSTHALVQKSTNIYITDEANILSEKTENYIIKYSQFLKEAENIDYYVVTVSDLENYTIEDYTDYLYDSFKLTKKGIIIVVSKNNRRISVKAGEALSYIISDELIDDYIKSYFLAYYKNGEWDKGTKNGYSAFYKLICEAYNIDASEMTVDFGDIIKEYEYIIIMIIIWICTIISYVYSKYMKKILFYKENSVANDIAFAISLITNILLLYLAYMLKPISVLIAFLFELTTIIGNFSKKPTSNKTSPKKKSSKKRKKK